MTRLFHVSDLHFGREDRAAIRWFADLVHAEKPDAVVCTGDLTMRARKAEFAAAAEWLSGLGVPVTVEPGNHDLPYFNPFARLLDPYRRYRAVETMLEKPIDLPGVMIVPLKTTARLQWPARRGRSGCASCDDGADCAGAQAIARTVRYSSPASITSSLNDDGVVRSLLDSVPAPISRTVPPAS